MNKTASQYDICKFSQKLSTLEQIRDYVERKMDFVDGFHEYEEELSTLDHIRDYVQMKIDTVMEKYCQQIKTL